MNQRHQQSILSLPVLVVLTGVCFLLVAWNTLGQSSQEPDAVGQMASDCIRCHTCEKPTRDNPCLPICSRFEAAAEEFAQKHGPDIVILDELAEVYLPVPFDHKGHAAMSEMTKGCRTCHHYTAEGHHHPACKTCHSVDDSGTDIYKPGLKGAYHRQCLNCHRDWIDETDCKICHRRKAGEVVSAPTDVPVADGDIISAMLEPMHPPITQPSTEIYRAETKEGAKSVVIFRHWEHVAGFDLRCVDCHHADSCTRCHVREGEEKPPATVREHHRPCARCHEADMDEGTTEITGKCKRCHWQEGEPRIKPFDHADTGWPLSKYHVGNRCRDCHKRVPFVKLNRECNACHGAWAPDNFNHGVTGQALDENHAEIDCEECHIDRKFDRAPTCEECHEEDEGIAFPATRPGPVVTTAPSTRP
jgi:hypothetical protein